MTRSRHSVARIGRGEMFEDRVLLSSVSGQPGRDAPEMMPPGSDPFSEFRTVDGTGNNLANSEWGSTNEQLLRLAEASYADAISAIDYSLPSPREISNAFAAQTSLPPNAEGLSSFVWMWGQFLDHDIDLTTAADPSEPIAIDVPAGDPFFDPFNIGTVTIDTERSLYDLNTGTDAANPRQQVNVITAFIDGSVVYGSDQDTADSLREFSGGRLRVSDGNLLPIGDDGLFLAGDVRANENVMLTSMQTLFMREHNRIAAEIEAAHPGFSDEEIYQRARAIVGAEIQAITYNEFLPALLGRNAFSAYTGYDPTVDASIANEFSTAAYRLGHSMLTSELLRLNADGSVIEDGNLTLAQAFFNPGEVRDHGIDSLLRGAATQVQNTVDNMIIDDVRNFLFGPPGSGGLDLASLNIARGRDHGLASYNEVRVALGLSPALTFADISSDSNVQANLASVYDSVDDVDLWVGGLAEDHVPGSQVGETFQTILVDQFERLRDGDRFWYQNVFSGRELDGIERTTLAGILERNTELSGLQENVFYASDDVITAPDDAILIDRGNGSTVILNSNEERFQAAAGPRLPQGPGTRYFSGDFNGDGHLDVGSFEATGAWTIALNDQNGGFVMEPFGRWSATAGWRDLRVGDFNGDGQDDVAMRMATGHIWIGQSTGDHFLTTYGGRWAADGWTDVLVGDFNGDGNADLAGHRDTGHWFIAAGTSGRFQTSYVGRWSAGTEWSHVEVGDFDGDGDDDLAGKTSGGYWFVSELQSNGRLNIEMIGRWAATGWRQIFVGDVNGDGADDLVGLNHRNELWMNSVSASGRSLEFLDRWMADHQYTAMMGDFNGDGRDDIAGFDLGSEDWILTTMTPFGTASLPFGRTFGLRHRELIGTGEIV
ncbi:MAG: VCBS repeat-containing protein [Planctomycetaceae bacterium]|nr:VCBS repeat-containing protein [Planctomycetaceae bacterium]